LGIALQKIPSPSVIIPSKHEENDLQYVMKAHETHLLKNEPQKINPEANREQVKDGTGRAIDECNNQRKQVKRIANQNRRKWH